MIDKFYYYLAMFYMYVNDFLEYSPEDIDKCCRR